MDFIISTLNTSCAKCYLGVSNLCHGLINIIRISSTLKEKKTIIFFVEMIKKVCGLYGISESFIGVSGD